jgi:hypothetical protein
MPDWKSIAKSPAFLSLITAIIDIIVEAVAERARRKKTK